VNQTRWIVAVACLAFTLASVHAWAETKSGFSLNGLNPFAKSTDSKKATRSPSKSSNGFKLPSLWPTTEEKKVRKRSTEPSAWDKFTSGTKSMFDKTTGAIAFWDDDKTTKKKSHGYDSIHSRYGVRKKEEEKKSFFSSWFSSEVEEPNRPRTVSEFLSQDKPKP